MSINISQVNLSCRCHGLDVTKWR